MPIEPTQWTKINMQGEIGSLASEISRNFYFAFREILNYFREISRNEIHENFAKRNLRTFRKTKFTKTSQNEIYEIFAKFSESDPTKLSRN